MEQQQAQMPSTPQVFNLSIEDYNSLYHDDLYLYLSSKLEDYNYLNNHDDGC